MWLPSKPEAILSLLSRLNPKLPTDGWKVVKVEKTERVTMSVVIFLNQACLERLAAQQHRVNYGFDKVQLRIYDTDKLAADNLAAGTSYEPPRRRIRTRRGHPHRLRVNRLGADREPEAAVHPGHKSTRALCSPGHSGGSGGYPARFQYQRWCSFCKLTCTIARQNPLPSSPAWQQAT
ncbi:uncharacterized protein [Drosophila suzukii]|uniref:Uncharacterized protein isoform X2 n=1 Tax=Drosophila suzukii TaxID=28584 RepID=A0AB40DL41_DROSZ